MALTILPNLHHVLRLYPPVPVREVARFDIYYFIYNE